MQKYEFIGNLKNVKCKKLKTMRPILLLSLLIFVFQVCRAQVSDDFSDGNFNENPAWLGSDSLFIINEEYQLQLNSNYGGEAWLSADYEKHKETEWRFWIKEKFSPSSKNFCDVFLYSDTQELKTCKTAYILRFGESGSYDVVELLRIDNGELTSLCRGTDTFIASSFSTFIKITYEESNNWKIFVDKVGNGNYKLEATAFDDKFASLNQNASFGFYCTFTNSNTKQFYFDNIYIGPKIIDSVAPELINCEIIDDFNLRLNFNEAICENSLKKENFFLVNQNLNPEKVSYGNDISSLILEFNNVIEEGIHHNLTIKNIEDLEGNISDEITHKFLHYNAKEYDIVINEIMADPSPQIELPDWEYVELYNSSEFPINIKNWKLIIGSSEYLINEDVEIQADDYLIICNIDAAEDLSQYGNCYGFSSFQISNSGANLTLIDKNENYISSINFDISWHSANYKKDGGWSLEQIDANNPCDGKPNWNSSISKEGGTPGKSNSIKNENIIFPKLNYINPISNNIIEVYFNQNMNIETLQNIENYYIKEMQTHPEEVNLFPDKKGFVELIFNHDFEENKLYTLNINNVTNCKDIALEKDINTIFGIPSQIERKDVIINEILFNPISPGVEYVELYNRSDKVIDLSKIMIGTIKKSFPNPADTIVKELISTGRILLPKSYCLLSTDGEIVKYQYESSSDDFLDIESLPSLPNEEGHIIICNKSREIIDEVFYSEKMHYDLLIETQGVSLERISSENMSSDKNNWHSASYDVNYGTPGYKNSMTTNLTEIKDDNEINIVPEIFSPDNDGFDDICNIYYDLDKNGYTLNIKIFNSKGRLVNNLLNNSLVNNEGFVSWNGCNDSNHHLEPGIYIVQTEIFDLEGFVKRIRKVVVVATKKSP